MEDTPQPPNLPRNRTPRQISQQNRHTRIKENERLVSMYHEQINQLKDIIATLRGQNNQLEGEKEKITELELRILQLSTYIVDMKKDLKHEIESSIEKFEKIQTEQAKKVVEDAKKEITVPKKKLEPIKEEEEPRLFRTLSGNIKKGFWI